MSTWDEFSDQRRRAIERFVNGDPDPYKLLWSHADDVTIFGGWGAYEQGWDAVSRRLDWAASRKASSSYVHDEGGSSASRRAAQSARPNGIRPKKIEPYSLKPSER